MSPTPAERPSAGPRLAYRPKAVPGRRVRALRPAWRCCWRYCEYCHFESCDLHLLRSRRKEVLHRASLVCLASTCFGCRLRASASCHAENHRDDAALRRARSVRCSTSKICRPSRRIVWAKMRVACEDRGCQNLVDSACDVPSVIGARTCEAKATPRCRRRGVLHRECRKRCVAGSRDRYQGAGQRCTRTAPRLVGAWRFLAASLYRLLRHR